MKTNKIKIGLEMEMEGNGDGFKRKWIASVNFNIIHFSSIIEILARN
jgi:hypothetical protein